MFGKSRHTKCALGSLDNVWYIVGLPDQASSPQVTHNEQIEKLSAMQIDSQKVERAR